MLGFFFVLNWINFAIAVAFSLGHHAANDWHVNSGRTKVKQRLPLITATFQIYLVVHAYYRDISNIACGAIIFHFFLWYGLRASTFVHRAALDACHVATLRACLGHACFFAVSTLLITNVYMFVYYVIFPCRAIVRNEMHLRCLRNVLMANVRKATHEVHVVQAE